MTNKTSDENESSIETNYGQRDTWNIRLPPPPPPPSEGEFDAEMRHSSAHIPLYEGDKDPR